MPTYLLSTIDYHVPTYMHFLTYTYITSINGHHIKNIGNITCSAPTYFALKSPKQNHTKL